MAARVLALLLVTLLLAGCTSEQPAGDAGVSPTPAPTGGSQAPTATTAGSPAPPARGPASLALIGKGDVADDFSKRYEVESAANLTYGDLLVELGGVTLPRLDCGDDVPGSWTVCRTQIDVTAEDGVRAGDVILLRPTEDPTDKLLVFLDETAGGVVLYETRVR